MIKLMIVNYCCLNELKLNVKIKNFIHLNKCVIILNKKMNKIVKCLNENIMVYKKKLQKLMYNLISVVNNWLNN